MARKITDFDGQINPIDSDYPYGDIKDDTGSGNGTDMNRKSFADMFQFFAKMMDYSGTVYNDLPDNAYSGFQFFNALIGTIKKIWLTGIGTYTGSGGDITTVQATYITLTPSATLNSALLRICACGNYGPSSVGESFNFAIYQNGALVADCIQGSVTQAGVGTLAAFSFETKIAYTAGDVITFRAQASANNGTFTNATLTYDGFGF